MLETQIHRKTTQTLMPPEHPPSPPDRYDIYPTCDLGSGKIESGFEALARRLAGESSVVLDGYVGIGWEDFRNHLDDALRSLGRKAAWFAAEDCLLPEAAIEEKVAPFLGGDDPIFGTRFTGELGDFFDRQKLNAVRADPKADVNILYGSGAALAGWRGCLVYLDLPKNELQFRSRAGGVRNLGRREADPPKPQYKRFYFVDWVALNRHKAAILPAIDYIVDGQRPDAPALMKGEDFRQALGQLAHGIFRVRPWFEPGPWGGQWILDNIPGLSPNVPNYAWSFELIVPENGLIFESDRRMLEGSFDFLMFHDHRAVLGDGATRFGHEFPIRYDFLDTFAGGNLSLQCHPRPEYIRRRFGENFTQDETYYILDAAPGAQVYLGFREEINPAVFRSDLEKSLQEAVPVDVDQYVQKHPARKHDLFLIPSGTIHCSGRDNLVLEISATPYIFTFKMYDWMRLDLDGNPRPLNIERAFDNLVFERSGDRVKHELISQPAVIEENEDGRLEHLPTHREHFYDVHRFTFRHAAESETHGSPHVLNLVEGKSMTVETESGAKRIVNYAETFVIPAAAGRYCLINNHEEPIRVVKTFLKPSHL